MFLIHDIDMSPINFKINNFMSKVHTALINTINEQNKHKYQYHFVVLACILRRLNYLIDN